MNYYVRISIPLTFKECLDDDRVKAFITHGGQNEFLEASAAGVPMIVISLFADQFHTAGCVKRNGQGVKLSKSNITETTMTNALTEVLYNPK